MKTLLAVLVLCAAPITDAGAQSEVKLLPIDEAVRRPDFFSFRAHLQAALARHDVPFVLDIVDPKIRNSFGPDQGKDTFLDTWRLNDPDSRFWAALAAVLALGGSFQGPTTFVAPYVYSKWPEGLDSFEHVAIVGSDVRVRAAPRADAAAVRRVSFAVLRRTSKGADDWMPVQLPDGTRGFVAARLARSPVDYRAFFMFRDGRWWLTAFVAGD